MKRQFSRSGSRGLLSGGRIPALIVAVALVVLLILGLVFPTALVSLARPLWAVGTGLTAAVGSVVPENTAMLKEERDRLEAELTSRTNELYALQAETADIARLGDTENRITAGVLARPPMSPYDTLIVEPAAAVRDDAQAYGLGGVPIGTVARSDGGSAHISLYSTAGRSTLGWAGEARIPVELVGSGSGAFRVSVAKDAGIAVGDLIYVPGPGALPIGTVARIDTHPSSPQSTLFVRPLVSPFSLTWVSIER